MTKPLQQAVQAVEESAWESYGKANVEVIRECAEVRFVPGEHYEHKDV